MISDIKFICISQADDKKRSDSSFQSKLDSILFCKKSLKPVKVGFEWATYFQLDAEALENVYKGQKRMDNMITPFVFPSLILRSCKLYQHTRALFRSKKDVSERAQNLAFDVATATGQVSKTTLWVSTKLFDQGLSGGLSYSTINGIAYVGCAASILSDLFRLGKDIKKYTNLSLMKPENLRDAQRLEDKRNYRVFKIAQDAGSLGLSILVGIGLLFQLFLSSFAALVITTAVLIISMAKFFFFEEKIMDKVGEITLLNASRYHSKQKSFIGWEETGVSIPLKPMS